jgi:hypothetical protein
MKGMLQRLRPIDQHERGCSSNGTWRVQNSPVKEKKEREQRMPARKELKGKVPTSIMYRNCVRAGGKEAGGGWWVT